jgi:uncharacterized protein (DUF362 family)
MKFEQTNNPARVAVVRAGAAVYPDASPYHPSENYPEYPFHEHLAETTNHVYAGVRQLFYDLGFDRENYGTQEWNPLGHLAKPGMTVAIKPNFVLSRHKEGGNLWSIITHPSVLRAVADYCWIALRGEGEIFVADAPQYDCNFQELLNASKLDEVCDFYKQFSGATVGFRDLRNYWSKGRHFPSMAIPLPGDPQGSVTVNLGERSALYKKPSDKLYGAVYHRTETISHHEGERHEYRVSRTIMEADVVISVPKLKVHKKVGVTLNMKGLVGICTNKNFLVHYTLTPPELGGDQYPGGHFTPMEEKLIKTERWMYDHFLAHQSPTLEYIHRSIYWLHGKFLKPLGIKVEKEKRLLDAGNWHGNDSAWRMTVDLLKTFYFADREGVLHDTPQRKMFTIIDGIIGGENKGPLVPDAKPAGVLLAGDNLLAVDLVATRLMGFDPMALRIHQSALRDERFDFGVRDYNDIEVLADDPAWRACLSDTKNRFLDFKPYPGWIGHIEISR